MAMEEFELLWHLDEELIVAAIRAAELRTSAEFRVFISDIEADDPVQTAREEFLRLGMDTTRDRNAVLIFVAPKSQNFAIVGDIGVHARCGEQFWRQAAERIQVHFLSDRFTDGIVEGITKVADALAEYFPPCAGDRNELSDTVVRA